jgi:hypothetical protein
MTHTVKILHRSHIPGTAGFDASGNPKQGKVRVIGEIDITSYTAAGEVIKKYKMGVENVDVVKFESKEFVSTATLFRLFAYDRTNEKLIGYAVDTAGGTGDELAPATTSSDLGIIAFEVIGDAAARTEGTITDSINTVVGTPLA